MGSMGRALCVQTRRHGYTDAWYVREPRSHAGVAAFKSFGGGFTFQLTAAGEDALAATRPSPTLSFG